MREGIKNGRLTVLLILVLAGAYFCTRLVRLEATPIFTDEAIYLRWSQIISGDPRYLYLPLTDGKPPLFMWLTAAVMKLRPALDPLLSGRLVSVFAGFGAAAGIFIAAGELFPGRKKVAFLAAALYLISPFAFVYDRMALADALLTMLGVWSLGLGVSLVRRPVFGKAVCLGLVLGFAWLTKTPALFFIALLPTWLLFFDFRGADLRPRLSKLILCLLIAIGLARLMYLGLSFLPQAYVINLKSYEFIVSPAEFLRLPFQFFLGNARALLWWTWSYLTWPVVVLIFLAVIVSARRYKAPVSVLIAYFLAPVAFMCFFNKVIYPRFLLPSLPALLLLAALGAASLWEKLNRRKLLRSLLFFVLFAPALVIDWYLLMQPIKAAIADIDSAQYLNSWSAGWGVREVNTILTREAEKNPKVYIGTEGTFGLMPYALEIYQHGNARVVIKSYWPPPLALPPELLAAAQQYPVFWLVYQRAGISPEWPADLVARFRQGESSDFLQLYKVRPQ